MPAGFVKEVFRPGTYQKGGVEYRITRDHVAAFWDGLKKLDRNGFDVPLHYEHPKGDEAAPVVKTEWDKQADRLRNTVGKVLVNHPASRINDRGALELAFSVSGKAAKKLGDQLINFVSPEIRTNFTDGQGREYGPVISHVALTHTPVQSDQAKGFQRVQLSEVGTAGFRVCMSELKKPAKPKPISIVQLAVAQNDADKPDQKAGEVDANDNPDMPKNPADKKQMQALIAQLAQAGLPLPSDTDESNLRERLLTALMVYNAAEQKRESEEQEDDDQGVQEAMPPTISQFSAYAAESTGKINKLFDEGRLTKGERDHLVSKLNTVQLSDNGAAVPSITYDELIETLGKRPAIDLSVQLSNAKEAEHHDPNFIEGGEQIKLGDKRAKEEAEAFFKRTGIKRKTA